MSRHFRVMVEQEETISDRLFRMGIRHGDTATVGWIGVGFERSGDTITLYFCPAASRRLVMTEGNKRAREQSALVPVSFASRAATKLVTEADVSRGFISFVSVIDCSRRIFFSVAEVTNIEPASDQQAIDTDWAYQAYQARKPGSLKASA